MPHRGQNFRGGRFKGRGRGRGTNTNGSRGRGRGQHINYMDDFDFPVEEWPGDGANHNNHRGWGRGGSFTQRAITPRGVGSPRGTSTPRGAGTPRGTSTPTGRGRGGNNYSDDRYQSPRGRGAGPKRSKLRSDAPLSKLFYEERPLLKPIIFVPSVHTRTLFEKEEELLQAQVEEIGDDETSHVPTAERVARVFSGGNIEGSGLGDDPEESDELEEIDFGDMGRIREEVDAVAEALTIIETKNTRHATATTEITKEEFTGFRIDSTSSTAHGSSVLPISSLANEMIVHAVGTCADTTSSLDVAPGDPSAGQIGFYIDIEPSTSISEQDTIPVNRVDEDTLLGEDDEDDIIVYVAPHPRLSKIPPVVVDEPVPSLPSTSILTGTPIIPTVTQGKATPPIPPAPTFDSISFSFANSPNLTKQPRTRPAFTVSEGIKIKAKARKKEARALRRRLERQTMFEQFGVIMSETQLRSDGEQLGTGRDPRWEERRRGDSDIDWGDSDQDESSRAVEVSDELGAMELDSDIDLKAMNMFVQGMSMNGSRHVTIDDLADEENMRQEDMQDDQLCGDESGSEDNDNEAQVGESEEEGVMDQGEMQMMHEHQPLSSSDGDDQEDDSSDDMDQSPSAAFKARLERLRDGSRGKKTVDADTFIGVDTSDEDDLYNPLTWAEQDENFIYLANNLLRGKPDKLFQAIQNGDFEELEGHIGPASRKKYKDVPPHLQEQWNKDRVKKAEYKRAREQARLEAAADPFTPKKGGKKRRKAMFKAAKLDPSISLPEGIVDLASLEQRICHFLHDIGGHNTMVLPPMEKESRKLVHELATAFNLKSKSKGNGAGRYTTLTKTTRSGIEINSKKIAKIMRRANGVFTQVASSKGKAFIPRHRDGDEVGKAAPKISETNIGFQMLTSMGWSEGDRIGISGGLDVPLTAVIKNTKLGLGANNR